MAPPRVAAGHYGIAVGGLPRLRERETRPNSLRSTNTLQNTQPQPEPPPPPQPGHCHPSGLQSWQLLATSSAPGAGRLLVQGTQIWPDTVPGAPGLGDIPDFREGAGFLQLLG